MLSKKHITVLRYWAAHVRVFPDWYLLTYYWRTLGRAGLSPQTIAELTGIPPNELEKDLSKYYGITSDFCNTINGPTLVAYQVGHVLHMPRASEVAYYEILRTHPKPSHRAVFPARTKDHLRQYPWPEFKGYHGGKPTTTLKLDYLPKMRQFWDMSRKEKECAILEHVIKGWPLALRQEAVSYFNRIRTRPKFDAGTVTDTLR